MNQEKSPALEGTMSGGTAASLFSTPRLELTAQWQDRAMLKISTPNLPEKGGETIEDIFKQLLPHGKPDCNTHLQENETID
jgi:hypothetical protein